MLPATGSNSTDSPILPTHIILVGAVRGGFREPREMADTVALGNENSVSLDGDSGARQIASRGGAARPEWRARTVAVEDEAVNLGHKVLQILRRRLLCGS